MSPEALYVVRRPGRVLLAGGHGEHPHHGANGDWRLNPSSQELPHHPHMISRPEASGLKWDTQKRAHFSVKAQNTLSAMVSVSVTK